MNKKQLKSENSPTYQLFQVKMEKIRKRYTGKIAVITASTQGIGFCIAERLGIEGASVVISSRKQVSALVDT